MGPAGQVHLEENVKMSASEVVGTTNNGKEKDVVEEEYDCDQIELRKLVCRWGFRAVAGRQWGRLRVIQTCSKNNTFSSSWPYSVLFTSYPAQIIRSFYKTNKVGKTYTMVGRSKSLDFAKGKNLQNMSLKYQVENNDRRRE